MGVFCGVKCDKNIERKGRKLSVLGFLPQNGFGLRYVLTEPLLLVLCLFFRAILSACGCGKNIEKDQKTGVFFGFLPQLGSPCGF